MRKLIVSMMVSADGFTEGPHKELDYFTDDEELLAYFEDLVDATGLMIFGRKSYELLKEYWPAAPGAFAKKMNARPKLVFSRSLQKAEWNSRIENDIPGAITALKQQPGKDLVLFAGAELVAAFREAGLVDEYRIMIYPVVLGGGTPFFQHIQSPVPLELLGTRTFKMGNVLLRYRQAP